MKTVLITGATKGIGLATAMVFASHNYNVVINYKDNDTLASKAKETLESKYQVKTLGIKADITKEDEVKKMILKIKEEFSTLDCLVNNAGIALDNDYRLKTKQEFLEVIDTNLIGTFLVIKYGSSIMETGSIINVASDAGVDNGYIYSLDYDASKAGVISLTKDFAKILAPHIRVNAVAPSWVNTNMNKNLNASFKRGEIAKILLGRFAEPEEIAQVIYFLASDEASFINGSIINVDGGRK